MKNNWLIVLMCLMQLHFVFAQSDSLTVYKGNHKLCEVQMRDGSSYKGYIEKQTDSLIYMKSSAGVQVVIPKHNVSSIDILKGSVSHDSITGMHITEPKISHYYYTTTSNAFLFRKGEIFGSTSYIVFGNVNYALSRNFSLGVSTSVAGIPLGLHAKANFELSHKFYLGFEGIAGSLMYLNPKTYGMGGTMKLTHGDDHLNYTFYAGYFDAEDWVLPRKAGKHGRPPARAGNYYLSFASVFAGFALSAPITGRTAFVGDVFAFPAISIYTASFGLRSTSKQKISWTGGFQLIKNIFPLVNRVFIIPYVGFSFRL